MDAANDEPTPSQIQLRVTYSEPMDVATLPQISTSNVSTTQSFVWDNYAGASGLLTVTIPPGLDASGPFAIRGGRDIAGNLLQANDLTGSFEGRQELGTGWAFEDAAGNCSLAGWQTSASGAFAAPVTVSGSSSRGRCAAVLGTLPGAAPGTGTVRLYQDVRLPSLTTTPAYSLEARVSVRPVHYPSSAGAATVAQRCGLADASFAIATPTYSATSANAPNYSTYVATVSSAAGTTVRLLCEVSNPNPAVPATTALYVDDVSIALIKPGSVR